MSISRRQIIDSIHDGAFAWSQHPRKKRYERDLVEEVAKQLRRRQSKGEGLDYDPQLLFREIRRRSGADIGTMHDDRNQADIVLSNNRSRPICVIEVKAGWITANINTDLYRVYQLIHSCSSRNCGSLRRGFLAVGRTEMSRERIDQIMKSITDSEELYRDVNIRYEVGLRSSLSIEMSAKISARG